VTNYFGIRRANISDAKATKTMRNLKNREKKVLDNKKYTKKSQCRSSSGKSLQQMKKVVQNKRRKDEDNNNNTVDDVTT